MDYKTAITKTQVEDKVQDKDRINVKDLPKGWIVLRKDGSIEDTLTPEQREEYERDYEDHRKQMVLDDLMRNMIRYKREDLEKEGYTPEEIDILIELMLQEQQEEEYEFMNSDNDSQGELSDGESDY
jgi:hypothetical protein